MKIAIVAPMTAALLALGGCAARMPEGGLAASLAGLRVEVPCADKFNDATECHWDRSLLQKEDPAWKLKREVERKFSGQPGVVYEVTVHVRGVVEPKNFTGGHVQFEHFQSGGDPVNNDYNSYRIVVSDPAATYTVNRNAEKVGHYTFPIDYRIVIPIRGGAHVKLGAYDSNDVAIANHQGLVIEGVAPAPRPFDGQFVQLDIESVRAKR